MSKFWTTTKRWSLRSLRLVLVLLVIGGVIYWKKFVPIPVISHVVERGEIVAEVLGTGTLEARVQTTISPKIAARVVELLVDQGSRVSAGDLLVRLDDEELKQQVAIAQANLEAASAAIVRLTTDKQRATAVYDQAKKSRDRTLTLIRQKAVSREEMDKATESLIVAEAGVARAEAAIAEGQKELVSAEKTLEYHRARLQDTKIFAPFDGLIVKRSREPGDIVVPGSSVLTLISMDELWINAWVDETEMARLAPGQPARVVFRSEPDRSYAATVTRLGREADRETREFVVDIRVLELPVNWAVGQRAEAFIETERRENALLLPAKFIVNRDGGYGVFLNVEGSAAWRDVRPGVRNRESMEILEGVAEGDVVVAPTNPTTSLTQGRKLATP